MTDREKKIAEIREALEKIDRGDLFEIAMAHEKSGEWLRFLLNELERLREDVQYWYKTAMSYKSMYEEVTVE